MQLALEGVAMIVVLLSLGSCVSQAPVPDVELAQVVLMQAAEAMPTACPPGFREIEAALPV